MDNFVSSYFFLDLRPGPRTKRDLFIRLINILCRNMSFFADLDLFRYIVFGGSEWGGPLVGCRLKFSNFVGSRLKFSIFVGSRLNVSIFVGRRKILVY